MKKIILFLNRFAMIYFLIMLGSPYFLPPFYADNFGAFIWMFMGMYFMGNIFSYLFYYEIVGKAITASEEVRKINKNYGFAEVNRDYFLAWDEAERSLSKEFAIDIYYWVIIVGYFLFWGISTYIKSKNWTFLIISILVSLFFVHMGYKRGNNKRTKQIETKMKQF